MRGVGRVVGERPDVQGGGVRLGEQGAQQDLFAPVFGSADGGGEQLDQVGRGEVGVQQVLVLGFPQDGDRIDGLLAAREGGQALEELPVPGQGEVVGPQPAHPLQARGLRGRTCQQGAFLVQDLVVGRTRHGGGRACVGQ